jgi:flavin-dependent dehydrogenase
VLGVADFAAGLVGALVGAVVGGAFAIAAGVIAARVQAKRTEEIALQLRRQERREDALWELTDRLRQIREELDYSEEFAEYAELFQQLDDRWRSHLAGAFRSGPIPEGYVRVRTVAGEIRDQGSPVESGVSLEGEIDLLLQMLDAETGETDHT